MGVKNQRDIDNKGCHDSCSGVKNQRDHDRQACKDSCMGIPGQKHKELIDCNNSCNGVKAQRDSDRQGCLDGCNGRTVCKECNLNDAEKLACKAVLANPHGIQAIAAAKALQAKGLAKTYDECKGFADDAKKVAKVLTDEEAVAFIAEKMGKCACNVVFCP